MELRKDYILNRFVLIAENRGKRPFDFKKEEPKIEQTLCQFCPGNENYTPKEIGRLGTEDKWKMRWFANKFSAVEPSGKYDITTDNKFFTFSDAYGYQEVIVETNEHKKQLGDLSEIEIKDLFRIYKNRVEELSRKAHVKYVLVFKNSGVESGTSLVHSHTQVIAFNHIPRLIQEEVNAFKTHNKCPFCEIINIEKNSHRRCFENDYFVAFAPYASRFNFEIWIFPKSHHPKMSEMDDFELMALGEIMKKILVKLKELNAPYNFYLHNAPDDENFHFHIEIAPRFSIFGGVELGSEVYINSVSPEAAAKFYRGEE